MGFFENYRQLKPFYLNNNFSDNYDHYRFGEEKKLDSTVSQLRAELRSFYQRLKGYSWLMRRRDDVQWMYSHLQDEPSREWLVKILLFKELGYKRVKLPLNTPDYWSKLSQLEAQSKKLEPLKFGYLSGSASKWNLAEHGYGLQMYASVFGVFSTVLLEQYRCDFDGGTIQVESGDIVIDGGGCYGDTALYFASKAGANGKVYSFEFMPENIEIFNQNLKLNPALNGRIEIVQHPLWNVSGEELVVNGMGPMASVQRKTGDVVAGKVVSTLAIDSFIKAKALPTVDFIKMDIEGAELNALKGARETILKSRPKLAISVYHKNDDIFEIAKWIDGLGLNYQFYLRHFTIHAEETVLFAVCPRQ